MPALAALTMAAMAATVTGRFIRPRFAPKVIEVHLAVGRVCTGQTWWGGEDLNLRPTDYESAALTN